MVNESGSCNGRGQGTRAILQKWPNHFGKRVTLRDEDQMRHVSCRLGSTREPSRFPMFSLSLVNYFGLLLFLIALDPAAAHLIEVSASKKECFFEDLHKNDQVLQFLLHSRSPAKYRIIDDCHISSWGRWAS